MWFCVAPLPPRQHRLKLFGPRRVVAYAASHPTISGLLRRHRGDRSAETDLLRGPCHAQRVDGVEVCARTKAQAEGQRPNANQHHHSQGGLAAFGFGKGIGSCPTRTDRPELKAVNRNPARSGE